MDRIPVVLSTDVGNEIDDQWTVVYLMTSPEIETLGLISAHAPPLVPPAAETSARILRNIVHERLGLGDEAPPIVEGASEPLESHYAPSDSDGARFLIEVSKPFSKERRLTVLTIGAATDVASAVLIDETIVDRIRVVAMGLLSRESGGREFNLANDIKAWQVLFNSRVPLTIGTFEVCRKSLGLTMQEARTLVDDVGLLGHWLWLEFEYFYYRLKDSLFQGRIDRPWIIWDNIVVAHLLGFTESETVPRPILLDDMKWDTQPDGSKSVIEGKEVTWITDVDEESMWADFRSKLERHQESHTGSGDTSVSYAIVEDP